MGGCPEAAAPGWAKDLEASCWNIAEGTRVLVKG